MTEAEVETILQRAREQYPGEHPRIIGNTGLQFIARDFKEFIRICGMTHVKTSPYYPQSNGKIERWFKTLKGGCIRVKTPLSLEDARRLVAEFVTYYNTVRLHRHRLCHAGGQIGRACGGHLGRAEREAGEGQRQKASQDRGERNCRHSRARYTEETWAEDRATRGRDPSADSGAKTGEGGTMLPHGLPGLARKR